MGREFGVSGRFRYTLQGPIFVAVEEKSVIGLHGTPEKVRE
jgi:hypothetical protein